MHPPELERQRERDLFDPGIEGARHGLARELSLAIWERVCADATDGAGRCDTEQARRRFHEIAARIAARGGRLRPDVGRVTRVGVEIGGESLGVWGAKDLAVRTPGRETLVAVEARRRGVLDQSLAAPEVAGRAMGRPELPGASEVMRAMAALQDPATAAAALREQLQQTFGDDARNVALRDDDGRVGSAEAVTIDETVFIGRWDDDDALLRVGHEVAHAIQQRRGRAMGETDAVPLSSGRRTSLEIEAERAGHALVGGLPFAVRGAAPSGVALFRGGPELPSAGLPTEDGARDPDPKLPPGQRRGERPQDQPVPGHGDGSGAASRSDDAAHPDGQPGKDAGAGTAPQTHADAARASQATSGGAGEGGGPGGGAGAGTGAGAAALPARAAAVDASDPGSLLSSLQQAPASVLMTTMAAVQAATPQAFQSMRTQAQDAMPRIQAPTGLPARADGPASRERQAADAGAAPREPTTHPGPADAAPQRTPESLVHEAPAAPPTARTELAGGDGQAHGQGQGQAAAQDPALARSAQSSLAGIRLGANQVPTTASEVPSVEMRGATNPSQLDTAHATSQRETTAASADARRATSQDRGEHDIFPKTDPDMLEAQLAAGKAGAAPRGGGGARAAAPDALPPEAMASIDTETSPILAEKIGTENQRYTAGKTEQDAAAQVAHQQTRTEIAQAEGDARARQTEAQTAARGEVTTARADWQREIDHIDSDFHTQATTARDQHRRGIVDQQQSANRRAAEHIQTAEREAEKAKRKAEVEANKKQEEGKKESGGFLGWLKSKAKALIDGIKAAVNFIYDNLRKAVKAVFEACKKLALAVIELARKAIVGLIKVFGEILKGLVKVALAAFPKLRDRILRRIDQAVQKATALVNSIAEGLKQAVTALIDFLAKTIDSILGLIQDLYNAALTVIGMLVTGELQELMRKVGQVIASAKTAPGQFETAAYEELLGGDLDQPLSPAELLAAGRTPPAADPAALGEASADAAPHPEANQAVDDHAEDDHAESGEPIPAPPWTDANVGVDEVARGEELEPELEDEVRGRTGGGDGTVEFGESSDETRSLDYMLGRTGAAGAQDAQAQPAAEAQHDAQPQGAQVPATTQQPATQVGADGLMPRERAQVKWQLMKKGLADWWAQKWPYVLAGGVLAVAGFIVANILTGGAILAALPAIMTVVGYVMAGLAIMKIVEHVRDFLQKAWNGDIRGGGKSLAKGLAAGAIELIMMLTFKVGAAAVRGARAAARGAVRGAQTLARGAVRTGRAAARATARGAQALTRSSVRVVSAAARGIARGVQYVIRAGKVLLRGVGRAISRGVKRLRELGARLLSRSRFKGFRIRIEGRTFILEGRINPWVVIARGELKVSETRTKGSTFLEDHELDELRRGGTAKPDEVREFDARRYHETTSQSVGKVGDGLTGDHIPSRAALVERFKLDNPGKPVPEDLINRDGVTVVLQGTDHATLSRTYAGRNTAAQILDDARDLAGAFGRDAEAILSGLQRDGRLTMEVVGAYQQAYRVNVMQGVFKYSADIDGMLNRFVAIARV